MTFMKQLEIIAAGSILDENFLRDLITQILLGLIVTGIVIWALYVVARKLFPNLKSWKIVLLIALIALILIAIGGIVSQQLGL